MFKYIFSLVLCLGVFNNSPTDKVIAVQDHLVCADYWAAVTFSQFCSLSPMNFKLSEGQDICRANENDTYPFDDVVSVLVYNNFSADSASEEYYENKGMDSSASSFLQLGNIGDDAYAFVNASGTTFKGIEIQILKGMYTVKIDINLGNDTNCFNEASAQDFARAIVEPL